MIPLRRLYNAVLMGGGPFPKSPNDGKVASHKTYMNEVNKLVTQMKDDDDYVCAAAMLSDFSTKLRRLIDDEFNKQEAADETRVTHLISVRLQLNQLEKRLELNELEKSLETRETPVTLHFSAELSDSNADSDVESDPVDETTLSSPLLKVVKLHKNPLMRLLATRTRAAKKQKAKEAKQAEKAKQSDNNKGHSYTTWQ